MKYSTTIIFLLFSILSFGQNVLSDSTYFVVENGTTFKVEVINYSNGGQKTEKSEVRNLPADFSERLARQVDRLTDIYNKSADTDERLLKLMRENTRIATQTGTDVLLANQDSIKSILIGTWTFLDFDRSSTIDFAVNGQNSLRYSNSGTGQVLCFSPTVIYLRNWRGKGLLLFKNGNKWENGVRKIVLTKP